MNKNVPSPLINPGTRTTPRAHSGRFGSADQTDENAERLLRGDHTVSADIILFLVDKGEFLYVTDVDHVVLARGSRSSEDMRIVTKGAQFIGWEHGPRGPEGWRVAYRFVSDFATDTFVVDRFDVAPDTPSFLCEPFRSNTGDT